MKMKIAELMEKARGPSFKKISPLISAPDLEVTIARESLKRHYDENFGPTLEALIRCKEAFISDDWEGPLKNQVIEAIEAASNVEVTK